MAKDKTIFGNTKSARRVFIRKLVDVLILAVVLWLIYTLAGRSLRQVAITQIAEFTNAKIKAQSIDFNFDGSVFIEKLVVRPEQILSWMRNTIWIQVNGIQLASS
jgi:hypothetical protein